MNQINSVSERRVDQSGFALMEVLVGGAIASFLFAAIMAGVLAIDLSNIMSKKQVQALFVIRGQIESLHATSFGSITDSVAQVAYDAGADNVFGTADDITGTLTTSVADAADFDNDGITAETALDVDGDGINDCKDTVAVCAEPYAKPVSVSFAWNVSILGVQRTFSMTVNTVIAR